MIKELYDIISSVYESMNQKFSIPLDSISEETKLRDLGIDSLTFVMIMLQIESYYKVNISSNTTTNYQTVKDVMDMIENELNKK